MFTQCPECDTRFHVSAGDLRVAQGKVRCGNCRAVFNALLNLTEQEEPVPVLQPQRPTTTVDPLEFNVPEVQWTSFFSDPPESSVRPGSTSAILQSTGLPESEPTRPADDAADDVWKQFLDAETNEETSAATENDVAQGTSTTPSVASPYSAYWDDSTRPPDLTKEESAPQEDEAASDEVFESLTLPPRIESIDSGHRRIPGYDDDADASNTDFLSVDDELPVEAADKPRMRSATAWPVTEPEDLRPDPFASPDSPLSSRSPRRSMRFAGPLFLLLALGISAQLLHANRETLATDPTYGFYVREFYMRLEQKLYPAWPLDAYLLREAQAVTGNNEKDVLEIVAEIMIRGSQPVAQPMVHVELRDRWSNAVASSVFTPAQYGSEEPDRLANPGEILPVKLRVRDPGNEAQGFEMNVCLPRTGGKIECANNPFR